MNTEYGLQYDAYLRGQCSIEKTKGDPVQLKNDSAIYISVPARLGNGQCVKEIGHILARE